jgi:isoaspartyl peptidase/L-asparaginase-like protein (Ntn-hydrolase superfamily)
MLTTDFHTAEATRGRWLFCADGAPPSGVHRTAGQHVEQTFKLARFQHFDGETWGAIALDTAGAIAMASTPSQFRPTYWLAPEGKTA